MEETFSNATAEELSGSNFDVHHTEEDGHGRHEVRTYFTSTLLGRLPNPEEWEGLQTIGAVLSEVTSKGKTTMECRYYIASIETMQSFWLKASGLTEE